MGVNREPLWPPDFTGSITHARGDAWAVAAPRAQIRGIGIDLEREFDERTLRELLPSLLAPGDSLERIAEANPRVWRATRAASLVFSAKESLYKCIAPLGGTDLDFRDAHLCHFDLNQGRFSVRLLRSFAPGLPGGLEFKGGVSLEDAAIRTWVYWPLPG